MKIDRNYLHQMYNATSTDDGKGDLETYENWLERQLISRIEQLSKPDIRNKLTPMKNLCALLDRADLSNNMNDLIKLIRDEVEQVKKNVESLSGNVA